MALEADSLFFTADLHLGHFNMTKAGKDFCGRPWENPRDMQEGLLRNWNEVVPKGGVVWVWVLGDVGTKMRWIEDFLGRANGTAHLVMGNHDENYTSRALIKAGFASVWTCRRLLTVKDPEGNFKPNPNLTVQEIILDHYPMRTWKKKPHGSWHLYGHVHDNFTSHDASFDVGVDCWDQRPISYAEVKAHIQRCLELGESADSRHETGND